MFLEAGEVDVLGALGFAVGDAGRKVSVSDDWAESGWMR